jgi:hypothetical protein
MSDARCETCVFFSDHRHDDDDPDEPNGYCGYDLANGVLNPYGGHWTHSDDWCSDWKPAPDPPTKGAE